MVERLCIFERFGDIRCARDVPSRDVCVKLAARSEHVVHGLEGRRVPVGDRPIDRICCGGIARPSSYCRCDVIVIYSGNCGDGTGKHREHQHEFSAEIHFGAALSVGWGVYSLGVVQHTRSRNSAAAADGGAPKRLVVNPSQNQPYLATVFKSFRLF